MQIGEWLTRSVQILTRAGISTARLDCLVLLEDMLNKNRTQILAHLDNDLTEVSTRQLDEMITKRAQHLPLAYIRGKSEFYGREFMISESVLEPRPESETIIELLTKTIGRGSFVPSQTTVADIGTGSGALAITTKLEHPDVDVVAIDVDEACLRVARQNATKHRVDIDILHGSLLEPLADRGLNPTTILLCNLPYVPDNFKINRAATHEPRHAIFGGADGLDLYRELFAQLKDYSSVRYVLCEAMPPQHDMLANIAKSAGFKLTEQSDFIQLFQRSN